MCLSIIFNKCVHVIVLIDLAVALLLIKTRFYTYCLHKVTNSRGYSLMYDNYDCNTATRGLLTQQELLHFVTTVYYIHS